MAYLIEFRFHGYAKWYAKNLIYDVARKFNVKGVTENRAVPHISLFGPFQTNDEGRLVSEIISVGKIYDLVPFRIRGFDFFNNQNKVIYLDIEPFEELKCLRWNISQRLSKLTYNYPSFDINKDFEFHSTIAFKDIDYKFDKIWNYIQKNQEVNIHQHLLRITIIKNSRILYEYDLMQKRLLNRRQALSKSSWNRTIELLKHQTSDFNQDIDVIQKHESVWDRIKSFLENIFGNKIKNKIEPKVLLESKHEEYNMHINNFSFFGCKNCEEFKEFHYQHGKWKPESNNWKKDYNKYKTEKLHEHTEFIMEETQCSVCGVDTQFGCKNCEEYLTYDHKGGGGNYTHGKWKIESDNWKKYKKCVKPKILWEYKGK